MIGSLLSMNPEWLLSKHFYLAGNPKFQPHLTPAPGLANTETILASSTQCSVTIDATNTIQCDASSQKAFNFLPWRPSGVTFTRVLDGSQLILTGPLSACHITAFEYSGSTYLIHANANAGVNWGDMSAEDRQANMATKENAITAIMNRFDGARTIAKLCYAPTPLAANAATYEGYLGFVVGCKARRGFTMNKVKWAASMGSDSWSFYFYGFNGGNEADRVLLPMNV